MPHNALLSWSGGKASALALHHALRDPARHVTQLLTSVNAHYQRVSMYRVRPGYLKRRLNAWGCLRARPIVGQALQVANRTV